MPRSNWRYWFYLIGCFPLEECSGVKLNSSQLMCCSFFSDTRTNMVLGNEQISLTHVTVHQKQSDKYTVYQDEMKCFYKLALSNLKQTEKKRKN